MSQLAQLNIARLRHPLDHPDLEPFVSALDAVNADAEAAPGFVWRLIGDGTNNATDLRPWGDDMIVNLSVWESVEALREYVYAPAHRDILRQRRSFFDPMTEAFVVLWWVEDGEWPTLDEAHERLTMLRTHGPTAQAFTFANPFDPVE